MPSRLWILSAVIASGLSLSVHAAGAEDRAPAQLDDGWAVATPAQAGFDPAALTALGEAIERDVIPNLHAVVIVRDGRLVYERYLQGRDERWGEPIGRVAFDRNSLHDLRSVTKSVTSVLLGIALGGDFEAALARPVTSYFDDLEGGFGEGVETVTLGQVMTMTAGLEWNEMEVPYTSRKNDEIRMIYASDPVAMVLGRPVRDPPGTRWYYNGGLTQVVAGLIQRETGQRLDAFAERALFAPLGISAYEWLGSPAWDAADSPSAASGLRLTARDLAKIGALFLDQGRWKGRQVVPADWLERSTRRSVKDIPWGPPGVYGYGFMWYPGRFGDPDDPAGYEVVRAVGNGDQRLFVVPEDGIVVVVFAGNYNDYSHAAGDRVFARVMAARRGDD